MIGLAQSQLPCALSLWVAVVLVYVLAAICRLLIVDTVPARTWLQPDVRSSFFNVAFELSVQFICGLIGGVAVCVRLRIRRLKFYLVTRRAD